MTKQIVQIKKINNVLDQISSKNLSIQFSLDGFSFCIYNQEKLILNFASYPFDKKAENSIFILQEMERVFSTEKLLQQDFNSVLAIHQNNLSTVVPDIFFDEKNLAEYLKHTVKVLQTDFIAFDNLVKIEAKNVYIPYVNINNYLFQNFGEFDYVHHLSILIDKLLALKTIEKTCFVHVSKHNFDVVVIENDQLIFSNTFTYHTKQDFVYYLLFVAEQLKLNLEVISVQLIGEITTKSAEYQMMYTYIRNIDFIKNPSAFFNDETTLLQHQQYLLIH